MKYSESMEMYVKEIYRLSLKNEKIRMMDVANVLKVSKASVNSAVKRLGREGLIRHEVYGSIELTKLGIKKARELCRKQKIIAAFLVAKLDIDLELAMEEACRLEHVLGDEAIKKMKQIIDAAEEVPQGG